jgi:hypothetical protein
LAIAMHRDFRHTQGLCMDAGPYVTALEYACKVRAQLTGKPAPALFKAAPDDLNTPAGEAAMIGDDVEADVAGAQAVGMQGILCARGSTVPATRLAARCPPRRRRGLARRGRGAAARARLTRVGVPPTPRGPGWVAPAALAHRSEPGGPARGRGTSRMAMGVEGGARLRQALRDRGPGAALAARWTVRSMAGPGFASGGIMPIGFARPSTVSLTPDPTATTTESGSRRPPAARPAGACGSHEDTP